MKEGNVLTKPQQAMLRLTYSRWESQRRISSLKCSASLVFSTKYPVIERGNHKTDHSRSDAGSAFRIEHTSQPHTHTHSHTHAHTHIYTHFLPRQTFVGVSVESSRVMTMAARGFDFDMANGQWPEVERGGGSAYWQMASECTEKKSRPTSQKHLYIQHMHFDLKI